MAENTAEISQTQKQTQEQTQEPPITFLSPEARGEAKEVREKVLAKGRELLGDEERIGLRIPSQPGWKHGTIYIERGEWAALKEIKEKPKLMIIRVNEEGKIASTGEKAVDSWESFYFFQEGDEGFVIKGTEQHFYNKNALPNQQHREIRERSEVGKKELEDLLETMGKVIIEKKAPEPEEKLHFSEKVQPLADALKKTG